MNVNYEKKEAMTFIGYHTEILPEEAYQKCPEFWDREYAAKYARLWQTMQPETDVEKAILDNGIGMFAICADAENGFEYWIAGLYQGGAVPAGPGVACHPAGKKEIKTNRHAAREIRMTCLLFCHIRGYVNCRKYSQISRHSLWISVREPLHDFDHDIVRRESIPARQA